MKRNRKENEFIERRNENNRRIRIFVKWKRTQIKKEV